MIALTVEQVKLLLSFAPSEPVSGLFPTSYFTLSYEKDLEYYKRILEIKDKLNEKK